MKEQGLDMESVLKAINARIDDLTKQLDTAFAKIITLEKENAILRERLAVYENPKNSSNSSIPPSKDTLKVQSEKANKLLMTRSLREKSIRPTGGQPGHEGKTMELFADPDAIEIHQVHYCTICGNDLSQIEETVIRTRQSVDIQLPVRPIITEHQIMGKKCSCGNCCQADFPKSVRSRISYGTNLRALVTYLSCSQYIPYKRMTEILQDCFGVSISQGTVDNILQDMKQKSQPAYEAIRCNVEQSKVAGADETGVNINGDLRWLWVFQTPKLSYIYCDKSRGKTAIYKHFKDGLPRATLVTDRHASYFKLNVAGHQICLAHILRELNFLTELDAEQTWSSKLTELIRESIHKRKTELWEKIDRVSILDRFKELLETSIEKLHQKIIALQKSLIKYEKYVFNFLFNPDIPYENNASERAVRPLKVKQKVSGSFRNEDAKGADVFCQIHSITQTAKKNNQNPFSAVLAVANNFSPAI